GPVHGGGGGADALGGELYVQGGDVGQSQGGGEGDRQRAVARPRSRRRVRRLGQRAGRRERPGGDRDGAGHVDGIVISRATLGRAWASRRVHPGGRPPRQTRRLAL